MTLFWLGAGIMLLGALGWILPAFWSRDALEQPTRDDHVIQAYEDRLGELEADYDEGVIDADQLETARDELAAELVADVRDDGARVQTSGAPASALVAGMVVIGLSIALYQTVGTPEGLGVAGKGPTRAEAIAARQAAGGTPPAAGAATSTSGNGGQGAMPSVEQMVDGLARRLESDPDDAEGWMMLGRSYLVLDRLEEARSALARAIELRDGDADALANFAEVIARLSDNQLNGEPAEYLARALVANPTHPKGLWLSGIAAMQRGAGAEAVVHWRALRETGALNAEETAQLDRMIVEAGGTVAAAGAGAAPAAGSAPAPAAAAPSTGTPGAAATGVSITVRVSLDGALADRVRPGDSLFVFARAEQGPPMPLAVQRLDAGQLPVTVVLDESMAMMPQFNLSTFPRVVVGARISRSGNATPSAGDLQGLSEGLAPGETPEVEVVISDAI